MSAAVWFLLPIIALGIVTIVYAIINEHKWRDRP